MKRRPADRHVVLPLARPRIGGREAWLSTAEGLNRVINPTYPIHLSSHLASLFEAPNTTSMTRTATMEDVPALQQLIRLSVRGLSTAYYTPAQTEAALLDVFGVDTQLIADGTYYLVDGPSGPIACGGWSSRRTLFGGDQMKAAEDPMLDPASDPARIRAFFVHPDWARRGLATELYETCERAAAAAGFRALELMATLPGEPLYRVLGFTPVERVELTLTGDVTVPFVRMHRSIVAGA